MKYQKIEDYIIFQRVSYGKPTTPVALREYRPIASVNSPVGTKREIEEWLLTSTHQLVFKGFILVDKASIEICTF